TWVTHPTAQRRIFSYNSMKRLLGATNPELGANGSAGTVSYTYDQNGNVATRQLGNVQTVYSYNGIDQLTGKTYNTGTTPWPTYVYNAGWRTQVIAGNSVSSTITNYSYDSLGRVSSSQQVTNSGQCPSPCTFYYSWNLADGLTSE